MNTIADLLLVLSSEHLVEVVTFLKNNEYYDGFSFTINSKIVDLVSKVIRVNNMNLFDLLIKYDFDVNVYTTKGSLLVIIATERGSGEFVEKLLKKGANVTLFTKNGSNGSSILSLCLNEPLTDGMIRCAELLIKSGADIEHLKGQGYKYYISQLLKQKCCPKNTDMLVDKSSESDGTMTIRMITSSQHQIVITHKLLNSGLQFIDNNALHKIPISINTRIELPASGEKILAHILPVGIDVDGTCLIKPMICRFIHNISVAKPDGSWIVHNIDSIYL